MWFLLNILKFQTKEIFTLTNTQTILWSMRVTQIVRKLYAIVIGLMLIMQTMCPRLFTYFCLLLAPHAEMPIHGSLLRLHQRWRILSLSWAAEPGPPLHCLLVPPVLPPENTPRNSGLTTFSKILFNS